MQGLEIRDLECGRGSFLIKVPSLQIAPGEVHCLLGKSGSGKSTVLLAIAGFVPAIRGKIISNGRELNSLRPERRQVGMVFQRSALFPHLTVFENVEFGLKVQKIAPQERKRRVEELLEQFDIAPLARRLPHQVSGGEAQRTALARALVPQFPVLLLDEPFSALDVELRQSLRKKVKKLLQTTGISTLLVTHDQDDAKDLADRVLNVQAGVIQ